MREARTSEVVTVRTSYSVEKEQNARFEGKSAETSKQTLHVIIEIVY